MSVRRPEPCASELVDHAIVSRLLCKWNGSRVGVRNPVTQARTVVCLRGSRFVIEPRKSFRRSFSGDGPLISLFKELDVDCG